MTDPSHFCDPKTLTLPQHDLAQVPKEQGPQPHLPSLFFAIENRSYLQDQYFCINASIYFPLALIQLFLSLTLSLISLAKVHFVLVPEHVLIAVECGCLSYSALVS